MKLEYFVSLLKSSFSPAQCRLLPSFTDVLSHDISLPNHSLDTIWLRSCKHHNMGLGSYGLCIVHAFVFVKIMGLGRTIEHPTGLLMRTSHSKDVSFESSLINLAFVKEQEIAPLQQHKQLL